MAAIHHSQRQYPDRDGIKYLASMAVLRRRLLKRGIRNSDLMPVLTSNWTRLGPDTPGYFDGIIGDVYVNGKEVI